MSFRGLKKFQKKIDKMKDDALHKVTRRAFNNLIVNSPVWIGNFRGSWLGSMLTPNVGGRFDTVDQSMSIAKGQPPNAFEVSNIGPAMKAKFGQMVYITNNVAYAEDLENGRSDQAPAGVLHVSTQQTRAQFSKSKAV